MVTSNFFIRLIFFSSCLVAVIFPETIFAGEMKNCSGSIGIVWSGTDGDDEEIFFSSYENDQWSVPFQITDNDVTDYLPVAVAGNDCRTWVVWSSPKEKGIFLYFRVFSKGSWSVVRPFPTGMKSNTAPSLLIGPDNMPWVVWAGLDGTDDDIFYSRWTGLSWSGPARVNVNDDSPDILPTITSGPLGLPRVQWLGFDGLSYVPFSSDWDGETWGKEMKGAQTLFAQQELKGKIPTFPDLPGFIGDVKKASIYQLNSNTCFSVPLRSLRNR